MGRDSSVGADTPSHKAGYDVSVMDVLHPQVHAGHGRQAIGLPSSVPLLTGDVTHAPDWDAVLRLVRPSHIVHLAAETGTGQSLSEATRHGSVNVVGTHAAPRRPDPLGRRAGASRPGIVAGGVRRGGLAMGEDIFYPPPRSHAQLVAGSWDPQGPKGKPAVPLPSRAGRTEPRPTSIYGATKLAQEHILTAWAAARDARLSVLRLQNVLWARPVAD